MRKKTLSVLLTALMVASMAAGCGKDSGGAGGSSENDGELKGDITFWHSFTQGGRMDVIQEAAEKFMDENPDVNITIETFSWGDFYTKWTTGLASGNVPDMSTALPGHVVEMMDAEAVIPVDDVIDDIGRDRFAEAALSEGERDGECYSLPLYSCTGYVVQKGSVGRSESGSTGNLGRICRSGKDIDKRRCIRLFLPLRFR